MCRVEWIPIHLGFDFLIFFQVLIRRKVKNQRRPRQRELEHVHLRVSREKEDIAAKAEGTVSL